jgi:hypothetical protein
MGRDAWRWLEEEVAPDLAHDRMAVVRGCLFRAIGWALAAGGVLGGGYVAIQLPFRLQGGLPGGTSLGFLVLGMVQGAGTGLAVGVASGLAFAALTLAAGAALHARSYRLLLGAVGAGIAVLATWAGRQALGWPYPLLAAGPADLLLGLALAGLGGWWVGDRVARWYVAGMAGAEQV